MAKRVQVPAKIKSQLQKEINSECPFCGDQDVPYFDMHHIDGDPSNSKDSYNLLMICKSCHGKIEGGAISYADVISKKSSLNSRLWKIEFVSLNAITECGWIAKTDNEFAFFSSTHSKPYAILNFTLINHLSQTVVLKEIEVRMLRRSRGISGIDHEPKIPIVPKVLTPITKYSIELTQEPYRLRLENPFQVPASDGFLFQLEVFPIEEKLALYLTFNFSNSVSINVPGMFFNCESEDELKTQIRLVGFDDTTPIPASSIKRLDNP